MKKALREAGCSPDDVDYISAHGTGTPTNDRNECAAIKKFLATDIRTFYQFHQVHARHTMAQLRS